MNLDTRIILLTMLDDKRIFLEAMESGVVGYVLKDSAITEILKRDYRCFRGSALYQSNAFRNSGREKE